LSGFTILKEAEEPNEAKEAKPAKEAKALAKPLAKVLAKALAKAQAKAWLPLQPDWVLEGFNMSLQGPNAALQGISGPPLRVLIRALGGLHEAP
jgi:hypothetical protein